MNQQKTGGSAFPNITPDMSVDGGPGMSLLDYFAAQTLPAIVSAYCAGNYHIERGQDGDTVADVIARHSYELGNAMLNARERVG